MWTIKKVLNHAQKKEEVVGGVKCSKEMLEKINAHPNKEPPRALHEHSTSEVVSWIGTNSHEQTANHVYTYYLSMLISD